MHRASLLVPAVTLFSVRSPILSLGTAYPRMCEWSGDIS
jgi:hypothetical protein